MKPTFANLEVDFWVHRGKLGANPSLCLFHDALEKGSQIIESLNELKNEVWPARRKLTFVKCSHKRALSSLRLEIVPAREDLQVMNIRCEGDGAIIEMTGEGLKLLISACAAWLGGAEDFCVCPRRSSIKPKDFGKLDRESGELWFWGPDYAP